MAKKRQIEAIQRGEAAQRLNVFFERAYKKMHRNLIKTVVYLLLESL